ncbi:MULTISPECIES: hypothetical protein [Niastella]|uniref:Uncharacterized protein n=1 Tax=Niastella soli TaxID=2821487 RepID=A0ABS3Z2H8_9BACT|nr:hypothetical protein [Niastella soli]MBO9204360.1 hypothetical protein [Niastella soli]
MEEIVSIEFEYKQKTYFALARIKEKGDHNEYHITVMNGALEQKLYGNHVFLEEAGWISISPLPENRTGQLRLAVGLALCKHFNKPHHLEVKTVH